jgi:hypothetical protein
MPDTLNSETFSSLDERRFSRPQRAVGSGGSDLSAALAESLDHPIDYPPLKDAVFKGDTIAIAVQHDLPRPTEVLNALLSYLLGLNIEPVDITVVLPGALTEPFGIDANEFQSTLSEDAEQPAQPPPIFPLQREFHSINCQVHDPENSAGLSYLCANEAAEPMHVNRVLVDADVVIPLGGPSIDSNARFQNCIYPTFGSSAAIARFTSDHGESSLADCHVEMELANDSLGAFFTIQTIAGPGEYIASFVSGVRQAATTEAIQQSAKLWAIECETNFDAAILTIESRAHDQSWQNFVAAVEFGSQLVDDNAPIVVWSEISSTPDKDIRKACAARFEETIPDSLSSSMQHLASVLKDHPVYLRSRVARGKIEELGLSVIESIEELQRLTANREHCVIIHDAHGCQLSTPQTVQVNSDVE